MDKPSVNKMNTKKDLADLDLLLKKVKYPERIIFSDPVFGKEKWSILKSFDIFFQSSRTEGMPIGVLEAMMMGKPCLVTEGSSMGKIINRADGGWVCETNVNGICQAIREILNTSEKVIEEKGANANKYVSKYHDWEILAKQLFSKVNRLIIN